MSHRINTAQSTFNMCRILKE